MNETNVLKKIQLALPKGTILFRNNTGMGWAGTLVAKNVKHVILENYRPLHSGLCDGSSDLIGWSTIEITADMVGKKIAVFTGIECKAPKGRTSPAQKNFINNILSAGGISGVAKSTDDALNLIKSYGGVKH